MQQYEKLKKLLIKASEKYFRGFILEIVENDFNDRLIVLEQDPLSITDNPDYIESWWASKEMMEGLEYMLNAHLSPKYTKTRALCILESAIYYAHEAKALRNFMQRFQGSSIHNFDDSFTLETDLSVYTL